MTWKQKPELNPPGHPVIQGPARTCSTDTEQAWGHDQSYLSLDKLHGNAQKLVFQFRDYFVQSL